MLGLYCKEDEVRIIPSLQPINIFSSGFNNKYLVEFLENLNYKPDTCLFCHKDLNTKTFFINNLIIVLSCHHVFHLNCFIKYCKYNYIQNLYKKKHDDKDSTNLITTCIICRKKITNVLNIFNCYHKLLENIRTLREDFRKQHIIM